MRETAVAERPELIDELRGRETLYRVWHPRLLEHPGPVLALGCLNGDGYVAAMLAAGKRVIGIDPLTTRVPRGMEHVAAVVSPEHGWIMLYGGTTQAQIFRERPEKRLVRSIRIGDVLALAGGDVAAMQMNIEGSEDYVVSSMTEPWADQITMAFHGRALREKLIPLLARWYDYAQVTTRNDWWFFLRREPPWEKA